MKQKHRKILAELQSLTNRLGGELDRTATSEQKLYDRSRANMLVSNVIYGVLVDVPENEQRVFDMEIAKESLNLLRELIDKEYKDRNGH